MAPNEQRSETERHWDNIAAAATAATAAFGAMTEAQPLTDTLEDNLAVLNRGAANGRPELVEIFSELVNNAAEHGMTEAGAQSHVRFIPHRRGAAFDVVVVDEGPGIREALARNPGLIMPDTDADAILLAPRSWSPVRATPPAASGSG